MRSQADLWEIDDTAKPYVEYLAGRAVPKVSPQRRHALVQTSLAVIFRRVGAGRGSTGTEWRVYLDAGRRTSLVPDVSFFSKERLQSLSAELRERTPFAPDVAVEVRSPDDRDEDVRWKVRAYLEHGALLVLDVFPQQRTIVAYDRNGSRTYARDDRFEHPAVPWLDFATREVFAALDD